MTAALNPRPITIVEASDADFDTVEKALRRSQIVADIRRARTGDVDRLTYWVGRVVLPASGGTK